MVQPPADVGGLAVEAVRPVCVALECWVEVAVHVDEAAVLDCLCKRVSLLLRESCRFLVVLWACDIVLGWTHIQIADDDDGLFLLQLVDVCTHAVVPLCALGQALEIHSRVHHIGVEEHKLLELDSKSAPFRVVGDRWELGHGCDFAEDCNTRVSLFLSMAPESMRELGKQNRNIGLFVRLDLIQAQHIWVFKLNISGKVARFLACTDAVHVPHHHLDLASRRRKSVRERQIRRWSVVFFAYALHGLFLCAGSIGFDRRNRGLRGNTLSLPFSFSFSLSFSFSFRLFSFSFSFSFSAATSTFGSMAMSLEESVKSLKIPEASWIFAFARCSLRAGSWATRLSITRCMAVIHATFSSFVSAITM
eukprot:comp21798_c0_seq1/m.48985 comp21798_c0_seq1/g.48985  ORF comp21798_c0_seq1/g.48985 comp21798_c0_seq1/m.48985 type:complete len:363 (-) comp21798_c0_seq1:964-2052(-)